MKRDLAAAMIFLLLVVLNGSAQSYQSHKLVVNANIGAPHLFKSAVKISVKSTSFAGNFDGGLEVSPIRGTNPVALRCEYVISKLFGLGLNYSFWNIRFDVTDHYNLQRQNAGSFYSDSIDVYHFKVSSRSLGIRPNIHIPLKSSRRDLYLGCGIGFTKYKLRVGFSSTDAGRFAKNFHQSLQAALSLPGGLYIAPTLGYRLYMQNDVGLNFELGFEKGAFVLAGIVFRVNTNGP